MILPLRSGRLVLSPVCVDGFLYGVRLYQLRYGGTCCSSSAAMDAMLRRALPLGTRWHAACLGAGKRTAIADGECTRCKRSNCFGAGRPRHGCSLEVLWTDVLVDFGGVRGRIVVDFRSDKFMFHGRLPAVRACSGGAGDVLAPRWVVPWGGPFGYAHDIECNMLVAPVTLWRSGERLLHDVGDDDEWEVVRGVLCKAAGAGKERST